MQQTLWNAPGAMSSHLSEKKDGEIHIGFMTVILVRNSFVLR